MTQQTHPPATQAENPSDPLPCEQGSPSELLAATHLFTVEVEEVSATPWAKGVDGLEHRELRLKLRLLERLKGALARRTGESFDLAAPQRRENAGVVSDYQGFWSHVEVEKGMRWLVIAQGQSNDPARLMLEPAITTLLDAGYAADVVAAGAAEMKFGAALRGGEDFAQRRAAAVDLLRLVKESRAKGRGPLGRYVWTRVAPVYPEAEKALLAPALEIIEAKDATPELRQALVAGVYDQVLSLGPTAQRRIELAGPLLRMLDQPEAASLADWLAQVPLYNLILGPGAPAMDPGQILPDPAARGRVARVLAALPSQRAKELRAWVEGGR